MGEIAGEGKRAVPIPLLLSPSSERILPLMPFKKPFYAPLKTRFLSPDEEGMERRRRNTLLVARQKLYERAVVSRDKQ